MKKILFIIGSLRAKSFNRQVANVAKEIIGSRAEVEELDYSDLPLLNQDIEQPEPEVVARIRKAVAEADGLWIFTPEYNMSYPGHLKNLLDWMSRPVKFMDVLIHASFKGFCGIEVKKKQQLVVGFYKFPENFISIIRIPTH